MSETMVEYLRKALHQDIALEECLDYYGAFPLAFRGQYKVYKASIQGAIWLAVSPCLDMGLVSLRKDRARVEEASGLPCALFLDAPSFYIKEKLMEENIPFVVKDKMIYLPFLGYLIPNEKRVIAPVRTISFLTQKLVLTAIYERWKGVSASKAAELLHVSKVSAGRCFDEIESLGIGILARKRKSRVVDVPQDRKELWQSIRPCLRSPVIARYELVEDLSLPRKAGISALCEYSLLSDKGFPTYGITKRELRSLDLKGKRQAGRGEDIGCVVLELGYSIDYAGRLLEDPLSVVLSLSAMEEEDERVLLSIDEMMEGLTW